MENEININQEVRVRMLENITREIKEDKEKKELRLELSSDLKEALRHFDSKINGLMLCMICGFSAMILTKYFS